MTDKAHTKNYKNLEDSFKKLLKENVSIVRRVPSALPDGTDGYGFSARHVQRLLRMVRVEGDPDIFQPDLKLNLLSHILGEGKVHQIWFEGETYFVAHYDSWTKALAKKLEVIEAGTPARQLLGLLTPNRTA